VGWLQRAWPLLRDVVILGTGVAIVWVQLILWALADRTPSAQLMYLAGGILGIPAVSHLRTVARTGAAGPSSASSPRHSSPPSPDTSLPTEAHGE
jgi:hypothetical protein